MCNVCVLCERFQPSYIRAYMQTHRPTDRRTDRQTCTTSSSPASFMSGRSGRDCLPIVSMLRFRSVQKNPGSTCFHMQKHIYIYMHTMHVCIYNMYTYICIYIYIYTLYATCRYLFIFIIAYTYKHIAEHTYTHTHKKLRACGHNHVLRLQRSTCDVGLKLYLIRAAAFVILKFNWGFESNL